MKNLIWFSHKSDDEMIIKQRNLPAFIKIVGKLVVSSIFDAMKRKVINSLSLFAAAVLLVLFFSFITPTDIEKLSATMTSRQVESGKTVTIKGDIYYQRNGSLVTHFTFPKEYIILANKFGEAKIYDVKKNTVINYQNFLFSTQSTQFYYFFSGRFSDMGLNEIGFIQDKNYYESGLFVTEWRLKVIEKKNPIARVKLVFDKQKPVYMDYRNAQNQIIRKVYYYNYTTLAGYNFPSVTTEVVYDGKDSSVRKTSYTDFKINNETTGSYFNYVIPPNAKTE